MVRALREGQERSLTPLRARPLVAGVTGKHHAVDHERVLAGCEQLRQTHVNGVAVHPSPLEGVVVGHNSAGRQPSPRDSHRLHSAQGDDTHLKVSGAGDGARCRAVPGWGREGREWRR